MISYALETLEADNGLKESIPFIVLSQFTELISRIASAALQMGFLLRGGATIGHLYHSQGVVFGDALIEPYKMETRTAIYPRIILSRKITNDPRWGKDNPKTLTDQDGLKFINIFLMMILNAAPPGPEHRDKTKKWFQAAVLVIEKNLKTLANEGRIHELAKWNWYTIKFRETLRNINPNVLTSLGIVPDELPSPR